MSISIATERSLLSHDEFEAVKKTHYPWILELSRDELQDARKDLRQRRDKERAITRRNRRTRQNRSSSRETSPDGESPHSARRKQVFAQALKRANHEWQRLAAMAAREEMARSARQALELRRAGRVARHPSAGRSADSGMAANPSNRRGAGITGAKVGSVSQATRNTQAKRDARQTAG